MGLGLIRAFTTAARSRGQKPRLHPNGFVQLDLSSDGRKHLHVWPAVPFPHVQKTAHPIHDHGYDMQSTVIRGIVRHSIFAANPIGDRVVEQGNVYRLYSVKARGNHETILVPCYSRASLVSLDRVSIDDIEPYQQYSLPAGVLHYAQGFGGITVTLMTKTALYKNRPRVAVPDGVEPDNTYLREYDEAVLWSLIDHAIK